MKRLKKIGLSDAYHHDDITQRVQFKLCLLVHLSLIGNAPSYITDLLQPVSTRGIVLRSATRSDLQVPSVMKVIRPLSSGTHSYKGHSPVWNPAVRSAVVSWSYGYGTIAGRPLP